MVGFWRRNIPGSAQIGLWNRQLCKSRGWPGNTAGLIPSEHGVRELVAPLKATSDIQENRLFPFLSNPDSYFSGVFPKSPRCGCGVNWPIPGNPLPATSNCNLVVVRLKGREGSLAWAETHSTSLFYFYWFLVVDMYSVQDIFIPWVKSSCCLLWAQTAQSLIKCKSIILVVVIRDFPELIVELVNWETDGMYSLWRLYYI